jgi:Homeodomain-like domain
VSRNKTVVKKYIVTLTGEEREQITTLIQTGRHPARKLLKARILLKADASDAGEGWSDSQIAAALETSVDTVARTRQRLVEEGLDAALTPRAFAQLGEETHLRRSGGSKVDRVGLFGSPGRTATVDVATVRGKSCRTEDRRARQ